MEAEASADAFGVRRLAATSEAGPSLPRTIEDPVLLRIAGSASRTPDSELTVFVGRSDAPLAGRLPVAGRYERQGQLLRFTPAYRFVAGQDYVVRTRRDGELPRFTEFDIPARIDAAPARVSHVYPSGGVVPENVLRFYVHFSVPMAPHRAWEFIRLRDSVGVPDDAAFMRFKQELWNEDRTRLTVLVDPGRIKRSVATNLALGPALLEGNRYALTIDAGWPSADGESVLPAWSKTFRVTAPLRTRPELGQWQWRRPRSATVEPLEARFDRPFERHCLGTALRVAASDGRVIAGTSQVGENEASWSFIPEEPWPSCDLRVVIDGGLEDVAGNSFRGVLDRDLSAVVGKSPPCNRVPV